MIQFGLNNNKLQSSALAAAYGAEAAEAYQRIACM